MVRCFAPVPLLAVIACSAVARVQAQCNNQWLPVNGLPGAYAGIRATTTWDPDGTGPGSPVVAVSLSGQQLPTPQAGGIATWDPGTGSWSTLRSPLANGHPGALVALANGDLIAVVATTGPTHHVMRWNGTLWSTIGTANGAIAKVVVMSNGDLAIGGSFTTIAGVAANHVARWTGSSWQALGSGIAVTTASQVSALTELTNGDLVVGGSFAAAGGLACGNLARWDSSSTSWSPLGAGVLGDVTALTTMPNGDVVASGPFAIPGAASSFGIARWNGAAWSAMGTGLGAGVALALQPLPNGDLVVAGYEEGVTMDEWAIAAKWSGSTWSWLPVQGEVVSSLTRLANGDLLFGGTTNLINSNAVLPSPILARLAGNTWSALCPSFTGPIRVLATRGQDDVVAVGDFQSVGGVSARKMARRVNGAWSAIGTGTIGPDGPLNAAAILPNGDVVVGGSFTQIDGVPANNIAVWNGTTWSALGSGLTGAVPFAYPSPNVAAIAVTPNGDLFVGGSFQLAGGAVANCIARWDGSTWWPLGSGVSGYSVASLLAMSTGNLVVGGSFFSAGGVSGANIAMWNGSSWLAMGSLSGYGGGWSTGGLVSAITEMPNGDIVAGGTWVGPPSPCIARWNGTAWTAMGIGVGGAGIRAVTALPNGDVLAGGSFTLAGSTTALSLVRWDGTTWSVPAGSLVAPPFGAPTVNAMNALPNGDILVGGAFIGAGPTPAPYHTVLSTPCPATATTLGTGCTGSGGANVLTATSLPWIGATCTTRATGMPTFGLAVRALGLTTLSTPLDAILPQSTPGCSLLATPDLLDLYVPAGGSVATSLTIPNTLALANQTLHQQVVALELSALGAITALTSTNALTLTIGAL